MDQESECLDWGRGWQLTRSEPVTISYGQISRKASHQLCPWARKQTAGQIAAVTGTEAAGRKPSFSKAPRDPPTGPVALPLKHGVGHVSSGNQSMTCCRAAVSVM